MLGSAEGPIVTCPWTARPARLQRTAQIQIYQILWAKESPKRGLGTSSTGKRHVEIARGNPSLVARTATAANFGSETFTTFATIPGATHTEAFNVNANFTVRFCLEVYPFSTLAAATQPRER